MTGNPPDSVGHQHGALPHPVLKWPTHCFVHRKVLTLFSRAESGTTRPNPVWKRIHDDLSSRIYSGEFTEGFPGEVQLAEEYGVSRGTVRQALRPLREAGIIISHRGRAPQVQTTDPWTSSGPVHSLLPPLEGDISRGTTHTTVQRAELNKEAAAHLGVESDTALLHLAWTYHPDGPPISLGHSWIPLRYAEPLTDLDFTHTSVYRELSVVCGISVDGGRETLRAVAADAEEAAALECEPGTPLLAYTRISASGDTPVEYRTGSMLGSAISVTHRF